MYVSYKLFPDITSEMRGGKNEIMVRLATKRPRCILKDNPLQMANRLQNIRSTYLRKNRVSGHEDWVCKIQQECIKYPQMWCVGQGVSLRQTE